MSQVDQINWLGTAHDIHTLDMMKGYWQVPLILEDHKKTVRHSWQAVLLPEVTIRFAQVGTGNIQILFMRAALHLMTDHTPLVWMSRNKDSNSQITRWFLLLQPFAFSVLHRCWAANVNADALSRRNVLRCWTAPPSRWELRKGVCDRLLRGGVWIGSGGQIPGSTLAPPQNHRRTPPIIRHISRAFCLHGSERKGSDCGCGRAYIQPRPSRCVIGQKWSQKRILWEFVAWGKTIHSVHTQIEYLMHNILYCPVYLGISAE